MNDEAKEHKQKFLGMDNMKMRKLDLGHYEMRRKPWNPADRDYEKDEAMAFRRYYRQPSTFGQL